MDRPSGPPSGTPLDGEAVEQKLLRLMDRYGFDLLGMAAAELGDRHAAEEAVQDAFYDAYRQLVAGRPVTRAWLWRAALWRTRRVRRSAWWRRVVTMAEVPPARSHPEVSVLDAVRELPRKHAEVLLLHHWAGFDVSETAAILGIAEGTVKSRLHRARAKLGKWMEREDHPRDAGSTDE
jgi:RNA polymerase sigma-70 factor (ECF subfamily)